MIRRFSIVAFLCAATLAFGQTNYTRMLSGVNYQSGAGYALQPIDVTRLTAFTSASATAVCLSSPASLCSGVAAGSGVSYGAGSLFSVVNTGTGTATITCSGCTINGAATLTLAGGQGADIYGDGTNYSAPSNGSNLQFSTAGAGWLSPLEFLPFVPSTLQGVATTIAATPSANQVGAVQFILPYTVTVRAVAIYVVTGAGAGFSTVAVYDSTGTNELINAGANAFDTHTASQTLRLVSITPVTLRPGVYWLATGSTDGAGTAVGYSMYQFLAPLVNANSIVRYGTAANSLSAGAMPSSLGTVTGFGTGSTTTIPLVLFLV